MLIYFDDINDTLVSHVKSLNCPLLFYSFTICRMAPVFLGRAFLSHCYTRYCVAVCSPFVPVDTSRAVFALSPLSAGLLPR